MKTILILSLLVSFTALARRSSPVIIPALEVKRGTVHQHFVSENQGSTMYVVKKDLTGKIVWKTKIFSKSEVQESWLKKMTLTHDGIIAVDEWDKEYQIDPIDGALLRPAAPARY